MQQYLTYLCTDRNESGPSLVIFLRVDQFYMLRFLFCRVYFPCLAVFKTFWVQKDGKIIFAGGFSEQSDMQKYIFQEMV